MGKNLGGPYFTIIEAVYGKFHKKVTAYAGTYALDKFSKSNYARRSLNGIPIFFLSFLFRMILNFLIFSRLKTHIWIIDFLVSLLVTIMISLMSPIFYTMISVYEQELMVFTDSFILNIMGPKGWEYLDTIKAVVFISIGTVGFVVLFFVEVNSTYLQEIILHQILSGIISDQIQRYYLSLMKVRKIYIGMTFVESKMYQLTEKDYIDIPIRYIRYYDIDKRIIMDYTPPKRAKIISKTEINKENDKIIPLIHPNENKKEKKKKRKFFWIGFLKKGKKKII